MSRRDEVSQLKSVVLLFSYPTPLLWCLCRDLLSGGTSRRISIIIADEPQQLTWAGLGDAVILDIDLPLEHRLPVRTLHVDVLVSDFMDRAKIDRRHGHYKQALALSDWLRMPHRRDSDPADQFGPLWRPAFRRDSSFSGMVKDCLLVAKWLPVAEEIEGHLADTGAVDEGKLTSDQAKTFHEAMTSPSVHECELIADSVRDYLKELDKNQFSSCTGVFRWRGDEPAQAKDIYRSKILSFSDQDRPPSEILEALSPRLVWQERSAPWRLPSPREAIWGRSPPEERMRESDPKRMADSARIFNAFCSLIDNA